MRLRIASYNIHGGVGRDGRRDVERVLAVVRALECDVVAMQEVAAAGVAGNMLAELAKGTGCVPLAGPTLVRHSGPYGNAVLTRLPVREVERIDLTVEGREPRGALRVDLECGGQPFQITATHLGLRPAERRAQIRRLLRGMPADDRLLDILVGDINEWFLWGRPLRWLHAHFGKPPAPATFPTLFPLLALDRIWVHPRSALRRVWAYDTALTRAASDHLPLVAELEWPPA